MRVIVDQMTPTASIIIVNYNGHRYLDRCLTALERLDYPADAYEVIVVDNASSDESVEFVRQHHQWVKVVETGSNLGFSGGNNAGIRESTGDYVVLLNNDTEVSESWLSELVKAAEANPQIGICTSKICLFQKRIDVSIHSKPFSPAITTAAKDTRELGMCISSVRASSPIEYLQGFFPPEQHQEGLYRWTRPEALLGLTIESGDTPPEVEFRFARKRPMNADPDAFRVRLGRAGAVLFRKDPSHSGPTEHCRLKLGASAAQLAKPVIQNAGTIIFENGACRDRGARVEGTSQFYESDEGQYDSQEEVFSGCGASMLMKRSMLDDIGLLDEKSFFMYYEDTDLCWRARLRNWHVMYVPTSTVLHVHCGTSQEWSPFFQFHTDRNRLVMLAKNAPARKVAAEWLRYAGGTIYACRTLPKSLLHRSLGPAGTRLKVCASLMKALPRLILVRRTIQKSKKVTHRTLSSWFNKI